MLNAEWTARTRQLLNAPHIATAFFAYSAHLLAEAAQVLGKEDDMREYSALHQRIKEAYIAEFVEDDGHLRPDRQASYVRALAFDLLPEHLLASAVQHLVELVQRADMHLGTGFLSTPYLCPVLAELSATGSIKSLRALRRACLVIDIPYSSHSPEED